MWKLWSQYARSTMPWVHSTKCQCILLCLAMDIAVGRHLKTWRDPLLPISGNWKWVAKISSRLLGLGLKTSWFMVWLEVRCISVSGLCLTCWMCSSRKSIFRKKLSHSFGIRSSAWIFNSLLAGFQAFAMEHIHISKACLRICHASELFYFSECHFHPWQTTFSRRPDIVD